MANKQIQSQVKKGPDVDCSWMHPDVYVWVEQIDPKEEEDAFKQGKILSFDYGTLQLTVLMDNMKKEVIKVNRVLERANFGNSHQQGFDDMVNMEVLNDAELLENVRKRFNHNLIYTYVGPTLLVINPFQKMPDNVTEQCRMFYIKHIVPARGNALAYKEIPPHVYALAAEAYRSLFENDKNQSIVISGESGAGKTVNAKDAMSLLTSIGLYNLDDQNQQISKIKKDINEQEDTSIEDKILECNPILEAFGNSKTKRNNNSSRFGKYVSMKVNRQTRRIQGAEIKNYLLEKSRLTDQGLDERNFHIFYHLLEGCNSEELKLYQLVEKNGSKRIDYQWFEYLKKCKNFVSPGIDDALNFKEVQDSFRSLGMKDDEVFIFSIVSAVLQFGNVQFDGSSFGNDTACKFDDEDLINKISNLLQIDQTQIKKALTLKNRKVGGQEINSPIPQADCCVGRDSLAKEIYDRLFVWLVQKLNETIQPEKSGDYLSIGLLDIYGFEVFEINTFEQLMINYTNEKLHQLYIFYVFKEEERVFVNEGLAEFCFQIKFNDNTPVIELLEKHPTGIFNLLDESCRIETQNDENLLQSIRTKQKGNDLLINPKQPTKQTFTIKHTAKEVEYSTAGFRAKNKDETAQTVLDVMSQSKNRVIAQMFKKTNVKGEKFLGSKIRKDMEDLMKTLNACDVSFIRCLKPNEIKKPNIFHQFMTLNQIRYLGVLDSLKVRKESYPVRRTYQAFYKLFGDIGKDQPYSVLIQKNDTDFIDITKKIVNKFFSHVGHENLLCGKTKIFMRQAGLSEVHRIYNIEMKNKNMKATKIQRLYRCYKFRQLLAKFLKKMKKLKGFIMMIECRYRYQKKLRYTRRVQRWIRYKLGMLNIKKYLIRTKILQKYIKRYNIIQEWNKSQWAIRVIQRLIRRFIFEKEMRKLIYIKQFILLSLQNAWVQIDNNRLSILGKNAIYIQKMYRGWIIRERREEGRLVQDKINKYRHLQKVKKYLAMIKTWTHGCISIYQIRRWNESAYKIQGYIRMKWLSQFFQLIRSKIIIIQRFYRQYRVKQINYTNKYNEFIAPIENNIRNQQQIDDELLFGSEQNILIKPNRQSSINLEINQKSNRWIGLDQLNDDQQENNQQKQRNSEFQSTQRSSIQNETMTMDSIFYRNQEDQNFQTRMQLFTTIIDLEYITDLTDVYEQGWAQTYKNLVSTMLRKNLPLQIFEVAELHTTAISVAGRAYAWGDNDMGQLGQDKLNTQQPYYSISIGQIKQFSSGETHNLALTYDGTLWAWGDNTKGQLGIGKEQVLFSETPSQINDIIDQISMVRARGQSSFIVTQNGNLYQFGLGSFSPLKVNFNKSKIHVRTVSCGNRFTIILMQNGSVWSYGENQNGQLGHGDTIPKIEPCIIDYLYSTGENIVQVECGFKHTIAKSRISKVFSWGSGQSGQLGHGNFSNELLPKQHNSFKNRVIQIAAGHRCSLILMDNHQIQWCGSNRTISKLNKFSDIKLETKSNYLASGKFLPVRIYTSWSHSLSIIQVTFAGLKQQMLENSQLKFRLMNLLVQKWVEWGVYNVDPPKIDQLAQYILEKHMKTTLVSSGQTRTENTKFEQFKSKQKNTQTTKQNTKQDSIQDSDVSYLTRLKEIKNKFIQLQQTPKNQWNESDFKFMKSMEEQDLKTIMNV